MVERSQADIQVSLCAILRSLIATALQPTLQRSGGPAHLHNKCYVDVVPLFCRMRRLLVTSCVTSWRCSTALSGSRCRQIPCLQCASPPPPPDPRIHVLRSTLGIIQVNRFGKTLQTVSTRGQQCNPMCEKQSTAIPSHTTHDTAGNLVQGRFMK